MNRDHIVPVVDPVLGDQGFDVYVDRLLCDESNYQIICESCHDEKSRAEGLLRQASKTEPDVLFKPKKPRKKK